MFQNRIGKLYKHLGKLARRQQVSCYRLYDYDLPEFPFCIEIYKDSLCVSEYKKRLEMGEQFHETWMLACMEILSGITGIPEERINLRTRQRKEGREGQYEKREGSGEFFTVEENGLKFLVNLRDYLDTGLFLDHRLTRQRVSEESNKKTVLNLFCYTGSFSVYAANGGAVSVTSVDLSKTYLKWAEQNMQLNGFQDQGKYAYKHADVKQYLEGLKKNIFDLVVMDPPTFSNSKRMKEILDIQRDHVELLNKTLDTMKAGGRLYFSNNLRSFRLDTGLIQASDIRDITRATTPFDFQGKLHRFCFCITK
jgi:23S rRNA (cytosine1962-C5)-methyltransferase